jgi:hypothetical protein
MSYVDLPICGAQGFCRGGAAAEMVSPERTSVSSYLTWDLNRMSELQCAEETHSAAEVLGQYQCSNRAMPMHRARPQSQVAD